MLHIEKPSIMRLCEREGGRERESVCELYLFITYPTPLSPPPPRPAR